MLPQEVELSPIRDRHVPQCKAARREEKNAQSDHRGGLAAIVGADQNCCLFIEVEMRSFQLSEIRDFDKPDPHGTGPLSSSSCGQRIGALAENGEIGAVAENAPSFSARDLFKDPEAFKVS